MQPQPSERACVVILGSTGMLGQAVTNVLVNSGSLRVLSSQHRDATAPNFVNAERLAEASLERLFEHTRASYCINCIGALKAEIDENSSQSLLRALRVNSEFPLILAEQSARAGIRVIHMSTDGVFSGRLNRPYLETDEPDAIDQYGKSKALGESPATNVLNVRCSIVGRDRARRKGLLEWLLSQPADAQVTGYSDQLWNGVTTKQFAEFCLAVIQADAFNAIRQAAPVLHFCPNPPITKFELLSIWARVTHKAIMVEPLETKAGSGRLLASSHSGWQRLFPQRTAWEEVLGEIAHDDIKPSQETR